MERLDHIGIAVASMEDAKRLFIDLLGMTLINEGSSAEFGVRFARLTPPSGATIELLEYLDKAAPAAAAHLLDHMAFAVDELEPAVALLQAKGVELDRPSPTITTREGGIDRSTTTLPGTTFGIRIQLVEHRDD
jgi:methylmalonyl-CoA/ethylmalonyl-CoA epimerase